MKKIWKMKKSKEAVSPVIATILMVAITVVLAAVLYVMVMGFGSNPDEQPDDVVERLPRLVPPHQQKVTWSRLISDPELLQHEGLHWSFGTALPVIAMQLEPSLTGLLPALVP